MQDKEIQELIEKIKKYANDVDVSLVEKAYYFGKKAHDGQFRKSGEPYFIHPVAVANILCDMELDIETIIAGLLHDVVEDTEYTYEDIEREFSKEIADLVDGVTKLGQIKYQSKEETQAENLRKMFLAMAKDIRVILIKLADRLHNMRTLKYMPPEKAKSKAIETLEIYGGIANRLGISMIKWELEDLALRYIDPEGYYDLVERVAKKRSQREAYIENVLNILNKSFEEVNIKCNVYGRPKHFYSIYKKMQDKHKNFQDIYDLMAVRIIVDTVKDCYAVLGMIHTLWTPMPGRFKDYIAMPKPNMYQSLHTTVIGPDGEPLEIQIRTKEMHTIAEYGIAAHWKYKEGNTSQKQSNIEGKLQWLRQMMEWEKDLKDPQEFMDALKEDVFSSQVYVFTPKGDVVELPAESTPIDFAYRVHTNVGNKCVGAKIDGRIVPLDYKLQNGNIAVSYTHLDVYKRQVCIPSQLSMLAKTIITLEGTARSLDPDFSISSVAQEFIKYYYINKLSVDKILLRAKDNTEEILFDIRSIPKQLKTILRNLENNNIKIQMEDIKFTSLERCITDLATKLSLSLVLASMVIGSSLIISSQNINRNIWIKMMAITGFSISFIIGILLIIKIFRSQYRK